MIEPAPRAIISASRRTDLPCCYPEYIEEALSARSACVTGYYGNSYVVDLHPDAVHTVVFWSKNYENFLGPRRRLRTLLDQYRHLHFLFSVTGLGGTRLEENSPGWRAALKQIPALAELSGSPERVTLRFDPILFWKEGAVERSNVGFFAEIADDAARCGVRRVLTSFTQWYGKSVRRASKHGVEYIDPPMEQKVAVARELSEGAARLGLELFICSQRAIAGAAGVRAAACIDAQLLSRLHPDGLLADTRKDPGQRADCGCSRSRDIGSYTQACANRCVYCYANPAM
ncbi:MAG: DUF1848 family protein [Acidobacteriota bacterium]